jgi:hypothetical protein
LAAVIKTPKIDDFGFLGFSLALSVVGSMVLKGGI